MTTTDQKHWRDDPHRAQPMGTVTERHDQPPDPPQATDGDVNYLRTVEGANAVRERTELLRRQLAHQADMPADMHRAATVSQEIVLAGPPPTPEPEPFVDEDEAAAVLVQFWVPGDVADALIAMRLGTVGLAELDANGRSDALAEYYSRVGQVSVQKGLQRWTERLTILARWRRS